MPSELSKFLTKNLKDLQYLENVMQTAYGMDILFVMFVDITEKSNSIYYISFGIFLYA